MLEPSAQCREDIVKPKCKKYEIDSFAQSERFCLAIYLQQRENQYYTVKQDVG